MSYTDDLLGDKAQQSFDTMFNLLRDLNIPISESKLTPLTTKIVCLGIHVDSESATMSVPVEKLEEIPQACQSFVKLKNFTKKQLQSILGSLLFIHKVVKPARYFLNRLLDTLRTMKQDKAPMTEAISKDINWFLTFVTSFNGTATYMHENLYCSEVIELDACLSGMGSRFNDLVYTYQFQNNEIPSTFTIVHFEMWNVLLALRLCGPMWQGKHIVL